MFEDGLDALVAAAPQHQGALAGCLQAFVAIALPQPQDAQAGAIGLLWVLAGTQDGAYAYELLGRRSGLGRPGDQALRCPLTRLAMGLGHVRSDGGVAPLLVAAVVARDPAAPAEALDGVVGDPHLHLFFDQGVGDRLVMPVDGHVVVDVHPGLFPVCVDIRL